MRAVGVFLRPWLDRLYTAGGVLAALCLIVILTLVTLQMLARWTGEVFPGGPDYAGYFMAAASFLAFAYALNYGAHIRVSILLNGLGRFRHLGEIWCFAIGSGLSIFFARYAIKTAYWSYKLNDISQGQDATPIWIPQLAMVVGTVILSIAMVDHLVRLIVTREHGILPEAVDRHTE